MSFHLSLTGHRPHLLGGYDMDSPYYRRLQETLELAIIGALDVHEHVTLHSGLALGADTVWSHAILAQKAAHPGRVSFICEVPFPGQADRWPEAAQEDWKQQMYGADAVNMYAESYSAKAMRSRNEGLVRAANMLLAVWNGTPSGTGHAVAFANKIGVPVHTWHPDEFRDSRPARTR